MAKKRHLQWQIYSRGHNEHTSQNVVCLQTLIWQGLLIFHPISPSQKQKRSTTFAYPTCTKTNKKSSHYLPFYSRFGLKITKSINSNWPIYDLSHYCLQTQHHAEKYNSCEKIRIDFIRRVNVSLKSERKLSWHVNLMRLCISFVGMKPKGQFIVWHP